MHTLRTFFLVFLTGSLSACATYESWPGSRGDDQSPAPVLREAPSRPQASTRPPAPSIEDESVPSPQTADTSVLAPTGPAGFLLEQAENQRQRGDLAAAATSIERAMRIQPGNPWLSLRLGEIRLAQGNAPQAELLAQRALTQSGGDGAFSSRCWRLTSDARAALGDQAGAAAALVKAGE